MNFLDYLVLVAYAAFLLTFPGWYKVGRIFDIIYAYTKEANKIR